jgi:hypothetical protein
MVALREMPFDLRRIKQRTDQVFNRTAKTMAMYVRNSPATPPSPTADLFAADTEPSEPGEFTKYFFRGQFKEKVEESYEAGGYVRSVKASITVPMEWRGLLAQASYIDPYLDGSRFKKVGQAIAQNRLYIIQELESVSLGSLTEVPL